MTLALITIAVLLGLAIWAWRQRVADFKKQSEVPFGRGIADEAAEAVLDVARPVAAPFDTSRKRAMKIGKADRAADTKAS